MKTILKSILCIVFFKLFTVVAFAQDIDLNKAAGKWVIENIEYSLTGRMINGESFPPTDESIALFEELNNGKADLINQYKIEAFSVEIKEGSVPTIIESYNSMVFGPQEVIFYIVFAPDSIYFSNGSKMASVSLYPKLKDNQLLITTPTDKKGIFMTYTFKRAQ
ncbi:MAG: hypothetical protein EAZ55_13820 [Cytophagales bacterium]|nr:MAG: hypothetical protein EAZ55_13820 [Cytophagales bacterium]